MNDVKVDNIDCELFLKNFTKHSDKLLNIKHCNIEESKNESVEFFKSPINFNINLIEKSKISKEILEITDLYPVNICIVDFILKEKILKEKFKLIDFGCGIPNLLYHLHLLGFKNLYGYDNWMQVDEKYANEFVENTGMGDSLISFEEIESKNITALSHVGCALSIEEYKRFLLIPTLEYVFADYRFTPPPLLSKEFDYLTKFEDKLFKVKGKLERIPESLIRDFGFEPTTIYDGLLLIYKKIK